MQPVLQDRVEPNIVSVLHSVHMSGHEPETHAQLTFKAGLIILYLCFKLWRWP